MKYSKSFEGVKFTEDAIRKSIEKFDEVFKGNEPLEVYFSHLVIETGNDEWSFDDESHFFVAYEDCTSALYIRNLYKETHSIELASIKFSFHKEFRSTTVSIETKVQHGRALILKVMEVLSSKEQQCRLPEKSDSNLKIFIGHGHSKAWRELKDHLVDKHN